MNVYERIGTELYHYGTRNIPYACYSQRPTTIGQCVVEIICDGIRVQNKPASRAIANRYVSEILNNYCRDNYIIRQNKRTVGVVYYVTIINNRTRHEECSIKIFN